MKKLRALIHFIMLLMTPGLFAYPHHEVPQEITQWTQPKTYDEIIQLLDDLQSGALEKRISPMELEHVNEYLAHLAKEGIYSDELEENLALAADIEDLMHGENSAYHLVSDLDHAKENRILPAVSNGCSNYDIIQCGKISKSWKKTKKFAKKHKKAIIIGASVVVVATAIIIIVSTGGSAAAPLAKAGAAAGAGALGSSSSKKSGNSEVIENPSPIIASNDVPLVEAEIEEHVSSLKEFLVEDKAAFPNRYNDRSFPEKAREAGSNLAHQAWDEIADLIKFVPQLCEEIEEFSSKFSPQNSESSGKENNGTPTENYEYLVSKGHEVIDGLFSTDQADLFTPEAKANDPMNQIAIGILPLPTEIPKLFSN